MSVVWTVLAAVLAALNTGLYAADGDPVQAGLAVFFALLFIVFALEDAA